MFATLPPMSRFTRTLVAGLGLCGFSLSILSCKEEAPEEFGFACVDLLQAENQDMSPFTGTAEIKVTLAYEPCLIDYYMKNHTEQQLAGTEGPDTFERWREMLCGATVNDPLVACEVESLDSFNQVLVDAGPSSMYQMTITYKVTDPAAIDGRTLLWGPGPLEGFASCEMGLRPYVKLTKQSDVIGVDKNGAQIWQAQSWSNPRGIMQSNTAGCIQASIERR